MSRTNAKSRNLRRRSSRSVAASVVAVILLAIGVFAVIAVVLRLLHCTWPVWITGPAKTVAALTWGSAAVIAAGVVIAVLGLIVFVAGVKLGALKTARLQTPAGGQVNDADYVISARAMAKLAAARADTVDGVDNVSASATGSKVWVRVTTSSEQTDQIRDRVRDTVNQGLTEAGVQPIPHVSANVRTRGI